MLKMNAKVFSPKLPVLFVAAGRRKKKGGRHNEKLLKYFVNILSK